MQDNQRNARLIKEIPFFTFQMGRILLLSFLALTKMQEIGALHIAVSVSYLKGSFAMLA